MFKNWTKADIVFYVASMTLLVVTGIIFKAAVISFIISVVGVTAGFMNMKANKYCYLFYIVQVALYSYVSWKNRFIGEAVLNAFYLLPLYVYSAFKWLKKNDMPAEFQIFKITKKLLIILALAGIVITTGYGYVLNLLNSNLPYVNALATFISIAAGYLSSRRIKEQWYFWVAASIIFSVIWISTLGKDTSQITLIFQNIPYVILNVMGLIKWNKLYNQHHESLLLTKI